MDTSVGEHPRTPSELEEVKEEFIAKNFWKRAMFWEDLALFVKAELDKHLKLQDPVVHSTSTYRVKTMGYRGCARVPLFSMSEEPSEDLHRVVRTLRGCSGQLGTTCKGV